jgi:hypothetical protein
MDDARAAFDKVKTQLYPAESAARINLEEARAEQARASATYSQMRTNLAKAGAEADPKKRIPAYLSVVERAEKEIERMVNDDPNKWQAEIANYRKIQEEAWKKIEEANRAPSGSPVPADPGADTDPSHWATDGKGGVLHLEGGKWVPAQKPSWMP